MEDWGNFLHQVLEEDYEDSTSIKVFLLVWGLGVKQWQLAATTGGRGCWRRRFQSLGGVLEKRRVKNRVFHAEEHIYNLQILLSELFSLSRSPLFTLRATIRASRNSLCTRVHLEGQKSLSATPFWVGIALSAPLLAHHNSLSGWNCAQRALLAQQDTKSCYFQNHNGQTVETCLRKLQTKFKDDPTVNESVIVILLEYVQVKFKIS